MFDSLLVTLMTPAIVIAVPLLVTLLKRAIPAKWSPLYPVLAGALGPLLEYAGTYVTGLTAQPGNGLLMGMAGVALREVVDQLKKVRAGKPASPEELAAEVKEFLNQRDEEARP